METRTSLKDKSHKQAPQYQKYFSKGYAYLSSGSGLKVHHQRQTSKMDQGRQQTGAHHRTTVT